MEKNNPNPSPEELQNFAEANVAQAMLNLKLAERFGAEDIAQTPAEQLDSARLFARDSTAKPTVTEGLLHDIDQVLNPGLGNLTELTDDLNIVNPKREGIRMKQGAEATEIRSFKDIIADITEAEQPTTESQRWITQKGNVSKKTREVELPVDQTRVDDLYDQLAMAVVSNKEKGESLNEEQILALVERLGALYLNTKNDDGEVDESRTWNLFKKVAELNQVKTTAEQEMDELNIFLANEVERRAGEDGNIEDIFIDTDDEGNSRKSNFHKTYDRHIDGIVTEAPSLLMADQLRQTADEKFKATIVDIRNERAEAKDAKLNARTLTKEEAEDEAYAMLEAGKNRVPDQIILKPADGSTPTKEAIDNLNKEAKRQEELNKKVGELTDNFKEKASKQGHEATVATARDMAENLATQYRKDNLKNKTAKPFEQSDAGIILARSLTNYLREHYSITGTAPTAENPKGKINWNGKKKEFDADVMEVKNAINAVEKGGRVAFALRNLRGKISRDN